MRVWEWTYMKPREFMEADGVTLVRQRPIVLTIASVRFAKALDRITTGSRKTCSRRSLTPLAETVRRREMKVIPLSKVYRLIEPGPVVLVTTAHKGRVHVMTLSYHMMLCQEPPVLALVLGFPLAQGLSFGR